MPVSSQRLQGYDLYKDGNGDEVTKAKGKKEHGFSLGELHTNSFVGNCKSAGCGKR